MPSRPSPITVSDNTEEGRAFLQSRIALFWRVMFYIILLSCFFGALGAIARPGMDQVLTVGLTIQSGLTWWMLTRFVWSTRALRRIETISLLLNLAVGGVLERYLLAGFARDHTLGTP